MNETPVSADEAAAAAAALDDYVPNSDELAQRQGPREVVAEDGVHVFVRGPDTDDHLALGGHEAGLRDTLYALIEETDEESIILNVGAHVGTWALRFMRFRPVVAYEANVLTAAALAHNVTINAPHAPADTRWCHIRTYAIWDQDDVELHLVDENGKQQGGSTRAVESAERVSGTVPVSALSRTLDTEFPADAPYRVGFINTDVEGAEARVLRGARELLRRDRPILFIELHAGMPGTDADLAEQVYAELRDARYEWYPIVWNDATYLVARPAEGIPRLEFEPEIIDSPVDDLTGEEAAAALRESVLEDMGGPPRTFAETKEV